MAYQSPPYYPFSQPYNQYVPQQQYQQQYQQPYYQPQQTQGLLGKMVESEDIVRTIEIPIGSFGVFPKADMSCVYIKNWNVDGTTKIVSYCPSQQDADQKKDVFTEIESVKHSISELSKKIDGMRSQRQQGGGRNEQ